MTSPNTPVDVEAANGLIERLKVAAGVRVLLTRGELANLCDQAASALSRLLAERRELEKELAEAREESRELTKALTGLTCNGSEFFVRKGDRYIADIPACVGWVRKTKTAAHERTVEAIFARQAAEGRALKAEAERREMLEALKSIAGQWDPNKNGRRPPRDIARDALTKAAIASSEGKGE